MIYNTVTLHRENFNLVFFIFSKIVKTNIDSILSLSLFNFLIVLQILFIEMLLDKHVIIFVYLHQLLLIYNDLLYNYDLMNIQ